MKVTKVFHTASVPGTGRTMVVGMTRKKIKHTTLEKKSAAKNLSRRFFAPSPASPVLNTSDAIIV